MRDPPRTAEKNHPGQKRGPRPGFSPPRSLPTLAGLAAAFLGLAALLGWQFQVTPLRSMVAGRPEMVPHTAYGVILAGAALGLLAKKQAAPRRRLAGRACALVVLLLGLGSLAGHLAILPQETLAQLLVPAAWQNVLPPSWQTALSLSFTGAALLLLDAPSSRRIHPAEALAGLTLFIVLVVLIGHLYDWAALYRNTPAIGMSLNTSMAFLALGLGVLGVRPRRGLTAWLRGLAPEARLLRRLLPLALGLPLAVGGIVLAGARLELYALEEVVSLAVGATAAGFAALLWLVVRQAHGLEHRGPEAPYQSLVENAADAILTVDPQGRIIALNPAAETLLGYPRMELLGRSVETLIPERQRARHAAERAVYRNHPIWRPMGTGRYLLARRKDGTELTVEIALSSFKTEAGWLHTAIVRDHSARKREEERLAYLATHDPLTGLYNRAYLLDRLDQALKRAQRERLRIALLYMDLDKLKPINDALGHEAGDLLLQSVARRLRQDRRGADTVARLGGDEFIVLIEEVEGQAAEEVAQKVLAALDEPLALGGRGQAVQLAASIGIACFPEHGGDAATLLRNADEAMYCAKAAGGRGYRFYTP